MSDNENLREGEFIMKEITTKKQAKEFCDNYILLVDTIIEFNKCFDGKISPCMFQQQRCQMYSGLKKLARLLGLTVYEKQHSETCSSYVFIYEEVEFFQLKRLQK